ncbi:MAG: hypothetical protein QW273_02920 [Candidatus Pacearchaeota archaeon]
MEYKDILKKRAIIRRIQKEVESLKIAKEIKSFKDLINEIEKSLNYTLKINNLINSLYDDIDKYPLKRYITWNKEKYQLGQVLDEVPKGFYSLEGFLSEKTRVENNFYENISTSDLERILKVTLSTFN